MEKKENAKKLINKNSNTSKEELLGLIETLQTRVQEQLTEIKQKEITIKEQACKIQWFYEQIRDNNRRLYGQSSEQVAPEQLNFFNEAEAISNEKLKEPEIEEITYRRKKKKGKREIDLSALPEEVIVYELDESECNCPNCSGTLEKFGQEERHTLEYIPASFKHIREITVKYICRECQKNDETTIVRAKAPKALITGSIASPSLVAGVMNGKYVNAMPLYRQEKEFKRNGIFINRQNMANWVILCANRYFETIYERMRESLLTRDVLAADETTPQVLKEPDRKPSTDSYMWVYRTVEKEKPVVLFDYQMTRAKKHPENFLGDFKGYLHCDGYQCYHALSKDIIIVGCFSHVRRYFETAWKLIPTDLYMVL